MGETHWYAWEYLLLNGFGQIKVRKNVVVRDVNKKKTYFFLHISLIHAFCECLTRKTKMCWWVKEESFLLYTKISCASRILKTKMSVSREQCQEKKKERLQFKIHFLWRHNTLDMQICYYINRFWDFWDGKFEGECFLNL